MSCKNDLQKYLTDHDLTMIELTELRDPWLQPSLSLCKCNMEHIYETSKFQSCGANKAGWSNETKLKELQAPGGHALVFFKNDLSTNLLSLRNNPSREALSIDRGSNTDQSIGLEINEDSFVGFVQYRFEKEPQNIPVLYVYELQLNHKAQGQGLGFVIMNYLEEIAFKSKQFKVMCTVQTANPSAMKFYKTKCRFLVDPSSPSFIQKRTTTTKNRHKKDYGYEILCKRTSEALF